jgi:cytochrome c-type biogenesis protein CcmH
MNPRRIPSSLALLALAGLWTASPTAARGSAAGQGADQSVGPSTPAYPSQSVDPVLEARTSELASQIRCPVCRGLSIEDSPTDLAVEMKGVIRERLAAGETSDQIKAYFVDRYGEWVLLRPTATGFNLALWVLPFLLLVVSGAGLAVAFRRWTRQGRSADPETARTV